MSERYCEKHDVRYESHGTCEDCMLDNDAAVGEAQPLPDRSTMFVPRPDRRCTGLQIVEVLAERVGDPDDPEPTLEKLFRLEDGSTFRADHDKLIRFPDCGVGDYVVTAEDGYQYLNPKHTFERNWQRAKPEPEIPDNGLRITPELLESKIKSETYVVSGRLTVCQLTLENGFVVVGHSSCVDDANFNEAVSRRFARADAVKQLWPLEGYLLRQRLFKSRDSVWLIAKVCHEVNRAYCRAMGDTSQVAWDDAPAWQQRSAMNGVEAILSNPDLTPEQSHESWLREKEADGWAYGPEKDPEHKTHPCCVPYEQLPVEQRAKDYIFGAVVRNTLDLLGLQP